MSKAFNLCLTNLCVWRSKHLPFYRGKQWKQGQVPVQFMCTSAAPLPSMWMLRARVHQGLHRLENFLTFLLYPVWSSGIFMYRKRYIIWHNTAHFLCLVEKHQNSESKSPSYSQGANASSMVTTRKGLNTGFFVQRGGNASLRQISKVPSLFLSLHVKR